MTWCRARKDSSMGRAAGPSCSSSATRCPRESNRRHISRVHVVTPPRLRPQGAAKATPGAAPLTPAGPGLVGGWLSVIHDTAGGADVPCQPVVDLVHLRRNAITGVGAFDEPPSQLS